MVVAKKIKRFLDENDIPYETLVHPTAYTAQEVAAATHISGYELAKAIIVKSDDKNTMAVLPATQKINMKMLQEVLNVNNLRLATEEEFKELFPDCEIGAQPLFGNLYDIDVVADESIKESEHITFNAGTHTDAIKISREDWERVVKPGYASFTEHV